MIDLCRHLFPGGLKKDSLPELYLMERGTVLYLRSHKQPGAGRGAPPQVGCASPLSSRESIFLDSHSNCSFMIPGFVKLLLD